MAEIWCAYGIPEPGVLHGELPQILMHYPLRICVTAARRPCISKGYPGIRIRMKRTPESRPASKISTHPKISTHRPSSPLSSSRHNHDCLLLPDMPVLGSQTGMRKTKCCPSANSVPHLEHITVHTLRLFRKPLDGPCPAVPQPQAVLEGATRARVPRRSLAPFQSSAYRRQAVQGQLGVNAGPRRCCPSVL